MIMKNKSFASENQTSALCLTKLNNIKIENKTDDSINDFANTIKEYKNKILNHQLPVSASLKKNQQFLDQILEFAKCIPSVSIPELTIDVSVKSFPKIEIEKSDSAEIKALIRKANRKTQTFSCDHSALERKALTYNADALKLRKRSELKIIDDFYKLLAEYCWRIKNKDIRGKEFSEFNIEMCDVDRIIEASMNFSAEVYKFNAKYHSLKCAKCEKMLKEFEYSVEDIEDRRKEADERLQDEIKRIQAEVDESEDKDNIILFVEEYFPGKERIPVMAIVKMWKAVKKCMIRKDEIRGLLEESGLWKITNVHNTLYATKIK